VLTAAPSTCRWSCSPHEPGNRSGCRHWWGRLLWCRSWATQSHREPGGSSWSWPWEGTCTSSPREEAVVWSRAPSPGGERAPVNRRGRLTSATQPRVRRCGSPGRPGAPRRSTSPLSDRTRLGPCSRRSQG
jgi:hypothetical protein